MLTALFLINAIGCSTTPTEQPQSARLTFSADRYPAVFEAAVETLRDHGYRIARRDYRFGTITTYPKEAATAAEFWIDDATTRDQKRADTLNGQQRAASVMVQKSGEDAGYSLAVEVHVERLQRPERYLTHSASPGITRTYTDVPLHLKDKGIDGPYAQRLDRDPLLERRLIEAIKAAVSEIDHLQESTRDLQSTRLHQQIELASDLLELASHDPLTDRQRLNSPELVTLDRFQRDQNFVKLFDLLDRLADNYPGNIEVIQLRELAWIEIARFEESTLTKVEKINPNGSNIAIPLKSPYNTEKETDDHRYSHFPR